MKTYTGVSKPKFLAEIRRHREADSLKQGTYGEQNGQWRGCAVACSLRSLDILDGQETREDYGDLHSEFETRGLWPEWLARLEDTIFEGLESEEAMEWPERLAEAVPVGVDIEPVKYRFCAFLMRENIKQVQELAISDELKTQITDAIKQVLAVHDNAIETGVWDEDAARSAASAESAAWSAASAAWSAASAARSAESAARSAARSAESAASSAGSAAWSAARSAEWSAAYKRYADELIRLLEVIGGSDGF